MASNFEEQRNQSINPPHSGLVGQSLGLKQFETGATRSADEGKADYEGFLSFSALEEFGEYMNRHRVQPDGKVRDSSNWKKGIPIESYIKSLFRHVLELVGLQQGYVSRRLRKEYPNRDINFLKRETACACFFNVQGFLHEFLKEPTSGGNIPFLGGAQLNDYTARLLNPDEKPNKNAVLTPAGAAAIAGGKASDFGYK